MERADSPPVLGPDGSLLTPPLNSDTSLQELIEAELRTRRASELPQEDQEKDQDNQELEQEPMVVAADLKPSRFIREQPDSVMVMEPAGRGALEEDEELTQATRVTEVNQVTRDIETAETSESREAMTRVSTVSEVTVSEGTVSEGTVSEGTQQVTKQRTQQISEAISEHLTERDTQQTTQQTLEEKTEQVTQQMAEQTSGQVLRQVKEEFSQHTSEQVIEQVTQETTEHVTEQITHLTSADKMSDELIETYVDEDQPMVAGIDAAETSSVHSSRSIHSSHSRRSSHISQSSGHSSRRSSAASERENQLLAHQEQPVLTGAGKISTPPPQDHGKLPDDVVTEAAGEVDAEVFEVELKPVEVVEAVDAAENGAGVKEEIPLQSVEDANVETPRSASPTVLSGQPSRHNPPPAGQEAPTSVPHGAETEQPTTDVTGSTPDVTAGDVMVTGSDEGVSDLIESSKVTDEDSDEGVGGGSERRADTKDAKKLRRKKKTETEKEAGRRRSSFGRQDSADHSARIHVRSFDSSKAISRFSKDGGESPSAECRSCGRRVFQMESVHAEGGVWHKNCFRCSQCNKQLTVDTYASHEGRLYCMVHHRQLLKAPPAAAPAAPAAPPAEQEDATDAGPRAGGGDVVGSEEQQEGPANGGATEIVKASNKSDYGLDDLQHMNVKDRFSVFERTNEDEQEKSPASVEVKRSQSILDKMKKFQGRTVSPDPESPVDSEDSGDEGRGPRHPDTVRSSTKKERPMSFAGLGDVKSRFERGGGGGGEMEQDPAKGEAAKLRGMICGAREHKLAYEEALREQEAQTEAPRRPLEDPSLVIQGNLRQSYERAVQESESPRPSSREEAVVRGRAADMASRFERGQLETAELNGHDVTQNGGSPSLETPTAADTSLTSELGSGDMARAGSPDSVPAADPELLHSDTTKRMLSKFKQLEQSAGHAEEEMSPHRERAQGNARQMLDKYRQMQEAAQKEDLPDGPRPLKSFTPPPEEPAASEQPADSADDASETAEDPDIVRAGAKVADEFLSKRTDQARNLREKFESWSPPAERGFTVEEDCKPSLETTRNLRAKFESLKEQQKPAADKPVPQRTSKFIMEPSQAAETCSACGKRVYAMERLEVDKRILHKNCFRCSKCNCVLRMDTYTFNAGKLFCTPHFKQIFKTKGNYDEGFGVESRAKNWSNATHNSEQPGQNGTSSAAPRSADEPVGTNGSASPKVNGAASPEPEQEPEQERPASDSEPEPEPTEPGREADVFQQVYESTVADGL